MRELVERMLALAGLQHRRQLQNPAPADLDALAKRVLEGRREQAARQDVDLLHAGLECPARVEGEVFLLEQAHGNFIDNALSFAPRGSAVKVVAEAGPDFLSVGVRDRGPGLPNFALDKVFTPFFSLPRPDGGPKGTGHGLCFVREVALLHGGTAVLANHPGGGAQARIVLPR